MTHHFRFLTIGSLVVGSCLVASADNPVKLLQNQLNSADYNLVNPASSAVVAGGFVVADNKHASYNGLPSGVTFPTNPSSASFFGSKGSHSFSLQALLSSIATIASGGLSPTTALTMDARRGVRSCIFPDLVEQSLRRRQRLRLERAGRTRTAAGCRSWRFQDERSGGNPRRRGGFAFCGNGRAGKGRSSAF